MKSFGLGLALTISGFTMYLVAILLKNTAIFVAEATTILLKVQLPSGVTIPEGLETFPTGVPGELLDILPYIGLGVAIFGLFWFWLIGPLLGVMSPSPRREATREAPQQRAAPRQAPAAAQASAGQQGKALDQWVAEAIQEKLNRERGTR